MPTRASALPSQRPDLLLRAFADAAPKPWHPRAHAREVGVPESALDPHIERLWLDGLVERVEARRKAAIRVAGAVGDLLAAAERRLADGEEWAAMDQAKMAEATDACNDWTSRLK